MELEFLMVGIGICIIPAFFMKNMGEKLSKVLYTLNFLIYGTISAVCLLFSLASRDYHSIFIMTSSLFFTVISLSAIVLTLDPCFTRQCYRHEIKRQKRLVYRLTPMIIAAISLIFFLLILWDFSSIIPSYVNFYWKIVQNPVFITFLVISLLIFLGLIVARPFKQPIYIVGSKYGRMCPTIEIKRRRHTVVPIIIISFIFLCLAVYFIQKRGVFLGQQQSEGVNEAGDALSVLYWAIMSDPLFIFVVVLVLIGGLAKVVASSEASELVSNVLILWLPGFMWTLVLIGVIAVPNYIVSMFGDIEFLAYLMYLLIYGSLMIGISAAISVFQSFKFVD